MSCMEELRRSGHGSGIMEVIDRNTKSSVSVAFRTVAESDLFHIDRIPGVDDDGGRRRVLNINENHVQDVTSDCTSIEKMSESGFKTAIQR